MSSRQLYSPFLASKQNDLERTKGLFFRFASQSGPGTENQEQLWLLSRNNANSSRVNEFRVLDALCYNFLNCEGQGLTESHPLPGLNVANTQQFSQPSHDITDW